MALDANPFSDLHWVDLFIFGKFILAIPEPNAKGHGTIADNISSRCREFSTAGTLARLDALVQKPTRLHRSHRLKQRQPEELLAHQVSRKLEDGDFRGAINLVRSEDSFAPACAGTIGSLRSKHPDPPADYRQPAAPDPTGSCVPITVDAATVYRAILSFPAGSAGGSDGLSLQHLKDLVRVEGSAGALTQAIAHFVNLLLQGNVPESIKPLFFGARLSAFAKKDGGIRPIAVGLTLRRLAS